MYHQLVAGPVVRYADVASEIRHRTVDAASFSEGATRLIYGLCKKVIVANAAGKLVDQYMGCLLYTSHFRRKGPVGKGEEHERLADGSRKSFVLQSG